VTIGVIENNTLITAAQLGEKVYIGTGATILGHLTIGNNAKIGANALIIKKNIPPAATIVGLYK
jgi:serine O-acetyltransferase